MEFRCLNKMSIKMQMLEIQWLKNLRILYWYSKFPLLKEGRGRIYEVIWFSGRIV